MIIRYFYEYRRDKHNKIWHCECGRIKEPKNLKNWFDVIWSVTRTIIQCLGMGHIRSTLCGEEYIILLSQRKFVYNFF